MSNSVVWASIIPAALAIIVGGAGIVGTLLVVNKTAKILITALIVVSGLITFIQAYQSARDANFMKNVLSTILIQSKPTAKFTRTVSSSVQQAAKSHKLRVFYYGTTPYGEFIYKLAPLADLSDDRPALVSLLVMGERQTGQAYLKYASEEGLASWVESALFDKDSTGSEDEKEEYIEGLKLVCYLVLNERENVEEISYETETDPQKFSCFSDKNPKLLLKMDESIINRLRPLPRGERSAQAYAEFSRQWTAAHNQ